ncbi:ABC transporter substrate-binding protein [Nocardioides caldifontis]|uniref:ABC transporter substrate-binding protein n=1 Tax=Nocardioides caldifontis TaxID=2588938 RepID=UPI0013969483|nr:extracellular solute-binding protein [Nocardioides caldifontis]
MAAARRLAGVLALVTMGAALSGCTGGDDPEPEPTTATTSATPSPSETATPSSLDVGVFGERRKVAAYQDIVDSFTAEHPEVEVEVTVFEDARAAADGALAALDFNADLDVFLADDRYLAELVLTGGLEPVDTLLEERDLEFGDDYQRVALTAFSANSRLQCMPADVSPLVVYVNTDLVDEASPLDEPPPLPDEEDASWTWEEFTQVARNVASVDGPGPVKGVYLPPTVELVTALVRSAGGDVVDDVLDPDSLTLASDDARRALTEAASLARDSSIAPRLRDLDDRGAPGMFADGELGMFVGTRADLPELRETSGLQFDVLPLPSLGRSRSVSLMTGWCLNADSDNVSVGADLIAHAVGPEGSEIAASSGVIVPSGLDAVHDEAFTEPELQPRNSHVFATAIRRSDPMPFAVRWDDVVVRVERLVQRLWSRPRIDLEGSLEDRLVRLDEGSEGILAEPE